MFKYKKDRINKSEKVWLFREDFVGHKPCLLPDGRVRTSTHDFESMDDLKKYLVDYGNQHSGVERYRKGYAILTDDDGNEHEVESGHEEMYIWYHPDANRRAVLRWIGAMCGLDKLCPDSGVSNLFPDPGSSRTPGEIDTVFARAPDEAKENCEMFLPISYELNTCCSALQDEDVDKDVLTTARPELSTFTSTYPLSTVQASIVSTILGNIEYINTERLFTLLLPVFVEAVDCGLNRRIANNELMSTTDPAEVERWMLNIIEEAQTNGVGRLPTVKEVLNRNKTIQFWN